MICLLEIQETESSFFELFSEHSRLIFFVCWCLIEIVAVQKIIWYYDLHTQLVPETVLTEKEIKQKAVTERLRDVVENRSVTGLLELGADVVTEPSIHSLQNIVNGVFEIMKSSNNSEEINEISEQQQADIEEINEISEQQANSEEITEEDDSDLDELL